MIRPLAFGLVGLALLGAGSGDHRFGDLRVTSIGGALIIPTAHPHFDGPGAHILDVAFVSSRVGFVVTQLPATIERTSDGGNTWRDVLRGNDETSYSWLATAGSRTVYVGGLGSTGRLELHVSGDAGATWKTFRPGVRNLRHDDWLALRPTFVTPVFGYTAPDPAAYRFGTFLRTHDRGQTWQRLHLPKGVEGIQFLDERHGFAVGSTRRCVGTAWRTDDGGISWKRIMCGRVPLAAVQFLDGQRGLVAGGWAPVSEQAPSSVVYTTSNSGRTWERRFVDARSVYRGGMNPIVELRFVDAERGWARTGQCKCCPSVPCAGEVLVTRDGGRTWARRGTEVEWTTVGARHAWVVPLCDIACDFVLRTRNAARTWSPLARADLLAMNSLQTAGGLVSVSTEAGRYASRDGRSWRRLGGGRLAVGPGFSVERRGSWRLPVVVSRHGARVVRYKGPAARKIQHVVVADATHAYALPYLAYGAGCRAPSTRKLYVTSNGGRSWLRRPVPFNVASLAADGRRVAIVGLRADCTNFIAVSDDDAQMWSIRRLPRKGCSVSVALDDLWLSCGRKLVVSRDRGATWTMLDVPRRLDSSHVAAVGHGQAWGLYWSEFGRRLLRTTDGGRTWLEQWPRLPTP